MFDFSIIIRTYNPEIRIIKRCLQAVQKLDLTGINCEVIIIENNNTIAWKDHEDIVGIISGISNLKIILEPKPGSSNAGIAGVKISNAPWLVFFDQDNESYPDYLVNLSSVVAKYPNVGIWGPGQVYVDFIDETTDWIDKNCRATFQEKKFDRMEFALQEEWNRCYPPGSGICVRKEVFVKYIELYRLHNFQTIARAGNSLMGAEDNQVIYTAILMGFAVGVCPELKLNHLIPAEKSNYTYVKKLRFFTRYSVPLAEVEFHPQVLKKYENKQTSQFSLFILLNKYLIKGVLSRKVKESIIDCLLVCGNYTGINLVLKKKNPGWLKLFLRMNGVEIK
ncbi:MAG: glycosyltransferase family 2 protein [Bacteroidetes bacterium]|nr:glycosyltransferase family 2 protein [Bacteroidota bacterium]